MGLLWKILVSAIFCIGINTSAYTDYSTILKNIAEAEPMNTYANGLIDKSC